MLTDSAEIPYGLALYEVGEDWGTPATVRLNGGRVFEDARIISFTAQGITLHVGEKVHFYPWHTVSCITYDEPM